MSVGSVIGALVTAGIGYVAGSVIGEARGERLGAEREERNLRTSRRLGLDPYGSLRGNPSRPKKRRRAARR